MERRTLLFGLGTAVAGSAVVLGSGAFTHVQAGRHVTIRIDEDSQALLGLVPNGDLKAIETDGGELTIDSSNLGGEGQGFNTDATVELGATDDDAFGEGDVGKDAFKVVNNFDQEITVTVDVTDAQPGDAGELILVLTDSDDNTERSSEEIEKTLGADEELLAALEFDTHEQSIDDGTITITATQQDDD